MADDADDKVRKPLTEVEIRKEVLKVMEESVRRVAEEHLRRAAREYLEGWFGPQNWKDIP